MTQPALESPFVFPVVGAVWLLALSIPASADLLGFARLVLMALGGLVVIAIFSVVAVAIVSGVIGMVEGIKKRRL